MNAHSRWLFVSASLVISFLLPTFAFAQTPQATQPTCLLTANPPTVKVGGSVTLKWGSTNATAATISHIGNVPLSGQLNILPSSASQTTFVGTFVGPGGTVTCSTLVTVTSGSTSGTGTGGAGGTGGSSYSSGSSYSAGSSYTTTPYTVNPANFTSQPTSNTFSQTPTTVTTPSSGNTVASFLVPCGYTSILSTDNGPDNNPYDAASCNLCYFGQLIQNIINFLIILSIPISAALFAWAGILMFSARDNVGQASKAKKIFFDVALGLVIALSGYLIVQSVLNAILSPNLTSGGWHWNSLQCTGNRPRNSPVTAIFQNLFNPTGTGTGVNSSTGAAATLSSNNTGACDPNTIAASAASNQVQLSSQQASFLACVAQPESACGTNISGAKTSSGTPSSAIGAFQIVVSTNAACVNNNVCAQAAQKAGYSVPSGGLNCKTAVLQGKPAGIYASMSPTDPNNLGYACLAAGSSFDCSVASASCLLQANPSGSDWTGVSDGLSHAGQQACTGILQQ